MANRYKIPLIASTLTPTRVPFADASGYLADDADMTFSGSRLTVTDLTVTNPISATSANNIPKHGVVVRPVGVTNPLPTTMTTPVFTLGATANPISYYYMGTPVTVSADKVAVLDNGTGATTTSGVLVSGKYYIITTFVAGDDFSNIATGLIGTVNTTGYTFLATGTAPTAWANGSSIRELVNTVGSYYVYFSAATGNILATNGFPGISTSSNVIIAYINWNGTNHGLVHDERHGYQRNCDWHLWAHDTIGVRWESGCTLTATGSTTTATLALTAGAIHDEDIEFAVPDSSTYSTANSCRHFWQTGVNTYVFDSTLSIRPYKLGTLNHPVYVDRSNNYTLTTLPAAANRFINFFFYVTSDLDCPLYMFVETSTAALVLNGYTSLAAARAIPFPNLSAASISGLSPELKPIYRVIVNGDGLVQTITSADDYRSVSSLPQSAGTASTTAATVTFVPTAPITSGNVQDAIIESCNLVIPYLMQSDSTTQTITTADTPQVLTFDTDIYHEGITRTSSSRFTVPTAGTYIIAFSGIAGCASGNKNPIEVWLKVDGTDVPASNTRTHVSSVDMTATVALAFIYKFTANQYFEFWTASDLTGIVSWESTSAVNTAGGVASPSVIITCNKVSA